MGAPNIETLKDPKFWDDLQADLLRVAIARRNKGVMQGKTKKNGKPDSVRVGSELEFFLGAYETISQIRAVVDDCPEEDRGKYYPVSLYFASIRGDSMIDALLDAQEKRLAHLELRGGK